MINHIKSHHIIKHPITLPIDLSTTINDWALTHEYHHWLQTSFKQPSKKAPITYHFFLQKKPTKHRRFQRSDTSATGRGGSPGGPSAAAVGPGWRWRSVAPGAGGTSGGWPRRVAGAVDANFWPWKCGWFGVDHGKTGIELWKMRMVSWKIGISPWKMGINRNQILRFHHRRLR